MRAGRQPVFLGAPGMNTDRAQTRISVSRLHFPVTTLGPGRRIGIWLQGCSIRCPGCVSADTWGFGEGRTTVPEVLSFLEPWREAADGVTVSGGEPFDQPDALLALLEALPLRGDQDVLVYSGYPIEAIAEPLARGAGLIDAVISDPFRQELPQTWAFRGSDNQRLNILTEKGRRRLGAMDRPLEAADRQFDLMFDPDGTVWLAGIPRKGDLQRLKGLMEAQGHRLTTTESTRGLP